MFLRKLRINCDRGVTLVELLIGVSLLGLVFSLAYSIYHFGIVTFNRGEEQIALQQEVRMVSKILSEELRFADDIDVLSSEPSSPYASGENYVFVKDNKLMQVTSGTANVLVDSSNQGTLGIKFKPNGSRQVDFEIVLSADSRSFEISSSVIMMNIETLPAGISPTGNVLKYSFK